MAKFVRKTKEERMLEIRNAALDLFLEKGFASTKMDDIVNVVDMSKGSVYRYYPAKDMIITDLFKDAISIRNRIMPNYPRDIVLSEDEIADFMTDLIFSKDFDIKYLKLYVIFLYEKMFDKDLEEIYNEMSYYSINSLHLDQTLNAVKEDIVQKLSVMVNSLILGKMILDKEFEKSIDKALVKKLFVNILNHNTQ